MVERKEFFLLRNIGKIDQTFKSVQAIHGITIYDPSEFEAPRFDCIFKEIYMASIMT